MPRSPTNQPWTPPAGAADRIVYRPRPGDTPPVAPSRTASATIATLLLPDERLRVEAAGQDLYHTRHQDSLDALATSLHAGPVGAVLVSTAALDRPGLGAWTAALAELARVHPAIPIVALVSGDVVVSTVFALGRCGLRSAVDVRRPEGWTALRHLLAGAARPEVAQLAAQVLAAALDGTSADTRRFVAALFEVPHHLATVRELARTLDVLPTTLMSRFFRARLPAPKRYLAFARLVRAADLLAHPSWSVASVADYMDYSSAQGFSRHLFLLLGVRPAEFRRRFTAHRMLARFADELLTPHAAVLQDFWPLRR